MIEELLKRVESGLVTTARNGALTIYNYSNHCVYEKAWDEFTMAARGLVLDDDGNVLARPWSKFFNLGERPDTMIDALPGGVPELSNKYDGSMIIAFHDGERWRVITRGCWDNEQTVAATRMLAPHAALMLTDRTYLFELIAPWNRIVLPYEKEELVLIGVIDTAGGMDARYSDVAIEAQRIGFRGAEYESKPVDSIALDDPKVRDREGFVARFPNGFRVKLKYRQYMILHKILTGLSIKGIWELLAAGSEPTFDGVPDEFMGWYAKRRDALRTAFSAIEADAKRVFDATPRHETRKGYALEFVKHPFASVLFAMLDGKDYAPIIWKAIRPEGKTDTFQTAEE